MVQIMLLKTGRAWTKAGNEPWQLQVNGLVADALERVPRIFNKFGKMNCE